MTENSCWSEVSTRNGSEATCYSLEFFPRAEGDPCVDYWRRAALKGDQSPWDDVTFHGLTTAQKDLLMQDQLQYSEETKAVVFRGYCLQQDGFLRF